MFFLNFCCGGGIHRQQQVFWIEVFRQSANGVSSNASFGQWEAWLDYRGGFFFSWGFFWKMLPNFHGFTHLFHPCISWFGLGVLAGFAGSYSCKCDFYIFLQSVSFCQSTPPSKRRGWSLGVFLLSWDDMSVAFPGPTRKMQHVGKSKKHIEK